MIRIETGLAIRARKLHLHFVYFGVGLPHLNELESVFGLATVLLNKTNKKNTEYSILDN